MKFASKILSPRVFGLRVHWTMMLGFENILLYLAILSRENECQISQNYILHMKVLEFYL